MIVTGKRKDKVENFYSTVIEYVYEKDGSQLFKKNNCKKKTGSFFKTL